MTEPAPSMELSFEQLQSMGLVTSNPLVKRDISVRYYPLKPKDQWADPEIEERQETPVDGKVTVYLRNFTASDAFALRDVQESDERLYLSIYLSTFTRDGKRLFPSLDAARGLDLGMWAGLVSEISALSAGAKKKRRKSKTSGLSSPSSSDAPSTNASTP